MPTQMKSAPPANAYLNPSSGGIAPGSQNLEGYPGHFYILHKRYSLLVIVTEYVIMVLRKTPPEGIPKRTYGVLSRT